MNIKSFDDCEQIMDLDINTLEDGKEYDKVCYLLNYKAGLTKQDKGFYIPSTLKTKMPMWLQQECSI